MRGWRFRSPATDDTKENVTQLRKTQAPIALRSLQTAITEYVEDMNTRLQAGLAVRQMPTSFEVHELEKVDTLLSLSLTGDNNVYDTQLVKRLNEMEAVTLYLRASLDRF